MRGLSARAPLGRFRTVPTDPSASVVVVVVAPPLRTQPVPSKLSALWPGASVYQLLSCVDTNGCDSSGSVHDDVSRTWAVAA